MKIGKRIKTKRAVKRYNAAVERLTAAANELGDVAFKSGVMTRDLFTSIVKLNALAKESIILMPGEKGGKHYGEATKTGD